MSDIKGGGCKTAALFLSLDPLLVRVDVIHKRLDVIAVRQADCSLRISGAP